VAKGFDAGIRTRDAVPGDNRVQCCVAKRKHEVVDDLLDALVWMRRKAKKHEPVDDLVDALMKMRRKAKKKVAMRKRKTKRKSS
jgi:ClpP class serine protease